MKMRRHAEVSLIAMGSRMPVPASVIIERLKSMPAPPKSTAIEVCRLQFAVGTDRSNGDSVVVIVRKGTVMTAMLRRSWAQQFNPQALRVQEVVSWAAQAEARLREEQASPCSDPQTITFWQSEVLRYGGSA